MFKALQPFKQPLGIRALQSFRFSTTAHRLDANESLNNRPDTAASSLFENIQVEAKEKLDTAEKAAEKEYHWSSGDFQGSTRKLNMIARQIRNLSVDDAIKQLEFSPKRSARKILHNLAFARKHAQDQKNMEDLVVAQAWVGKGLSRKRAKYHGRGQFGVMHQKRAHMKFILKEAAHAESDKMSKRNIRGWKETKKVWTPLVENKPIYNAKSFYNW
ncbi:hypothetical protein DFQ28_005214 [Apophysomyces sp. BC1034]|nr:hypothetical protein DFQ30_005027 [Apophysomyces sp. BC1015]KAG0169556.1 hypothetical protein DFQ29_009646 [Apophysomyces sp. BC1021]KAG0188231.1 hypothetical protein DFQ28_005214 [Apophysomyces sp. BC1034]